MKLLLIAFVLIAGSTCCFAQKNMLSYDDIKYLLHNNLHYADTFLVAKGYLLIKSSEAKKTRKYTMTLNDGSYDNVEMRSDGKKLFIEIETNELDQYNLIRESISQYLDKEAAMTDVQSYSVKDLGSIYITISD